MKRSITIILLSMFLCTACTGIKDAPAIEEKPEEQLVSREYFIENCGYSEQELEGIDIDEFINVCRVTEQYMKTSEFKTLLKTDVENARKSGDRKGKYSYLIKSPLKKIEAGMLDEIKLIYIQDVYEGWNYIYLFDFESNEACKGPYLSYFRKIKADDREQLIKLIKESGIENITELNQEKPIEKGQEFVNSYEVIIETYNGEISHIKGSNVVPEEVLALVG